jgi:hypothetical protein
MQPSLAVEIRRQERLDPYGKYGNTGAVGVSGVTVRTLQREVTAGGQPVGSRGCSAPCGAAALGCKGAARHTFRHDRDLSHRIPSPCILVLVCIRLLELLRSWIVVWAAMECPERCSKLRQKAGSVLPLSCAPSGSAGPHVKLLKPRQQLLRNLQPPGPTFAFTRRRPDGQQPDEREQVRTLPRASPALRGPHRCHSRGPLTRRTLPSTHVLRSQLPPRGAAGEPANREDGAGSPKREAPPGGAPAGAEPAVPDATDAGGGPSQPFRLWARPRQWLERQGEEEERAGPGAGERGGADWVPPPATLLRVAESTPVVPAVRTMNASPPREGGLSPTRLLRLQQGPTDHQPTR